MIFQLDLITPTAALGERLKTAQPPMAQFDEKVSLRGITRPLHRSLCNQPAHPRQVPLCVHV